MWGGTEVARVRQCTWKQTPEGSAKRSERIESKTCRKWGLSENVPIKNRRKANVQPQNRL